MEFVTEYWVLLLILVLLFSFCVINMVNPCLFHHCFHAHSVSYCKYCGIEFPPDPHVCDVCGRGVSQGLFCSYCGTYND